MQRPFFPEINHPTIVQANEYFFTFYSITYSLFFESIDGIIKLDYFSWKISIVPLSKKSIFVEIKVTKFFTKNLKNIVMNYCNKITEDKYRIFL